MTRRCAICKRVAVKEGNKFWPLCSERCQLIDLGKWLGEEYRIPEVPEEDGDGAPRIPDPDDERHQ